MLMLSSFLCDEDLVFSLEYIWCFIYGFEFIEEVMVDVVVFIEFGNGEG